MGARRSGWVMVAVLMLATCASTTPRVGPPAAQAGQAALENDGPPIFFPGEQLTWRVTVRGIEGARARLALGTQGKLGGRSVVVGTLEVESAGLAATVKPYRQRVTSWVDVKTGIPLRSLSETVDRGSRRTVDITRRGAKADFEIHGPGAWEERRPQPLPTIATHDGVSILLALRSWLAPAGSRAVLYHLDQDRLWRTDYVVVGVETVSVPLGRRRAVKIEGKGHILTPTLEDDPATPPRATAYWFSDDAQRVPLRIQAETRFGAGDMQATTYAVRR